MLNQSKTVNEKEYTRRRERDGFRSKGGHDMKSKAPRVE